MSAGDDSDEDSLGEIFSRHLHRVLRRGTPEGVNYAVALRPDKRGRPLMLRPFLPPAGQDWAIKGIAFTEALRRCAVPAWSGVPLRQVLARAFKRVGQTAASARMVRANAWFAAVVACRHARALMDRMGIPEDGGDIAIDPGKASADFDVLFGESLRSVAGAETLIWALADRCLGSLARGPLPSLCDKPPRFLQFALTSGAIVVRWIAGDDKGTVLWEQGLDEFADAAFGRGGCLEAVRKAASSLSSPLEETGTRILRDVSPELARVVDTACARGRRVGVRLAAGSAPNRPGLPMSLWLYVDPERRTEDGIPDVTLAVNRGHDEFALEGSPPDGLYYFPPCVLSARVTVGLRGLCVEHKPAVLIPRGGPPWEHPYTGGLEKTAFTAAVLLTEGEPALRRPSAPARRTFPRLSERLATARERDLCLEGQEESIKGLVRRFGGGPERPPDIAALSAGLHDILRLGLTRGHSNNKATPRTKLRNTVYPLGRGSPTEWIRRRVFKYDLGG